MEVTQGLGFSSVSNQWIPAPDCSQSLIPVRLALTTTQLAIIEDRVTFSCIEREEGSLRPKKDENGNYIGHACHPGSCNRCNENFPLGPSFFWRLEANGVVTEIIPKILAKRSSSVDGVSPASCPLLRYTVGWWRRNINRYFITQLAGS
jgi:hypothetical protein